MLFCGLAATFALYMRRYDLALIALVVLGLSWHGLGRGVVAPSASILFPSGPAAREVADLRTLVPDAPLISTYTEPSFVFLTRGEVELRDADAIAAQLASGDLDSPLRAFTSLISAAGATPRPRRFVHLSSAPARSGWWTGSIIHAATTRSC